MNSSLMNSQSPQTKTLFWINHRLRQPLCSALGIVQLLHQEDLQPQVKNLVQLLEAQLTKIDQLTKQAVTDVVKDVSGQVQRESGVY
ncbi:hypothetical protein QNI19_16430 [Cytophagaceae bacterium DM2B3-1]|uniref:Signal transduction histidine kinase dimerisation/phosphoacceptor domain-containing protein n=1 Tax=Xanthocytophaga flava TaxID=3048013 RepID=A0ABT7CLF9_9BACT|nr:hypothetical protein [Xanthocytophaga flavus]MDJ1494533.1 hypothetical protein [Xanthocytophaga flavus]